jgi:hypothetical protein
MLTHDGKIAVPDNSKTGAAARAPVHHVPSRSLFGRFIAAGQF